MSEIVDPSLVELATDAGYRVSVVGGATLIEGMETSFVARADDLGGYVLERSSRGSAPRVEVRSNSWPAIQLVLCMNFGADWRSENRLPRLDTVERGRPIIEVELLDAAGIRKDVHWGQGQYAIGLYGANAIALSHLLGRPIKEVVDSYRDPDGLPVFA